MPCAKCFVFAIKMISFFNIKFKGTGTVISFSGTELKNGAENILCDTKKAPQKRRSDLFAKSYIDVKHAVFGIHIDRTAVFFYYAAYAARAEAVARFILFGSHGYAVL